MTVHEVAPISTSERMKTEARRVSWTRRTAITVGTLVPLVLTGCHVIGGNSNTDSIPPSPRTTASASSFYTSHISTSPVSKSPETHPPPPTAVPTYESIHTPSSEIITYMKVTLEDIRENYTNFLSILPEINIGIQIPEYGLRMDPNRNIGVNVANEAHKGKSKGEFGSVYIGDVNKVPYYMFFFFPLNNASEISQRDAAVRNIGNTQKFVGHLSTSSLTDLGFDEKKVNAMLAEMSILAPPGSNPIPVVVLNQAFVVQLTTA